MKGHILKSPWGLVFFIVVSLFAGLIGSLATRNSVSTWYVSLEKPPFNPPNWIFGPVWTLLYILMGVAAFLIWREKNKNPLVKRALGIFFLQLILNAVWSILFFGLQSPFFAFLEIIVLWMVIFIALLLFFRVKKLAAYLIVPYLIWVTFASILNFAIWRLN